MACCKTNLQGLTADAAGVLFRLLSQPPATAWHAHLPTFRLYAKSAQLTYVTIDQNASKPLKTTLVHVSQEDALFSQAAEQKRIRRAEKEPLSQATRFVDKRVLEVRAGRGGNGCVAYMSAGGSKRKAAGGHGGSGGSVILQASKDMLGLGRVQQLLVAPVGVNGGPNGRQGGHGDDCVVMVPVGTVVKKLRDLAPAGAAEYDESDLHEEDEDEELDEEGGEEEAAFKEHAASTPQLTGMRTKRPVQSSNLSPVNAVADVNAKVHGEEGAEAEQQEGEVLAELLEDGQQLIVARGGRGGLGNTAFSSKPWGPPSERHTKGKAGERVLLQVEAKLIADVGLVGFPNAGKSTLLGAMSAARAKVAPYAFTTTRPQLGALWYDDGSRLILADLPGLVEGAHANRGRGNEFLRHIERTRCLIYLVDLSGGPGALVPLSPGRQLEALQQELQLYRPGLLQVPAVVVANKADSVHDTHEQLASLMRQTPLPVILISAKQQAGLEQLKAVLRVLAPNEATAGSDDDG